jgi:ankyrin repeat protein
VSLANRYGWTILHQAGYSNSVEMARLALDAGGRVDQCARGDGGTPLAAALFWGNVEVADLLAEVGVHPLNLRIAAGLGRLDLLAAFFDPEGSIQPSAGAHRAFYRPHGGFPYWKPSDDPQEVLDEAFVYACKSGRLEAMELLIQRGARIDADPYRGTGLTWAGCRGQVAAVRWLIAHGADVSRRGTFGGPSHGQGVTALHLAAQSNKLEAVRCLVESGADTTIEDDLYHSSALGWAEHFGCAAVAGYLRHAAGKPAAGPGNGG